ncbi:MAG: GntR family transcriptional regulator [Chitinivibrionales bacterium]|nr:GntR family transcriptional regulator [Chitinivibrionales bacterium]
MKKKPGSATQKAVLYVCYALRNGEWRAAMPTIKELARDAGVSLQTMWNAIQILKQRGIIENSYARKLKPVTLTSERAKKIINEFTDMCDPPQKNIAVWEQAAANIKHAILTGVYGTNKPLPTLKELRNSYHISFVTLKKALESLREEGFLFRYNKTYAVTRVGEQQANKRIVFSTISLKYRRLTISSFSEDFVRYLEAECAAAQIRLDHILQLKEGDRYVTVNNRQEECSFTDDDSVLGYIVLVYYPPDEAYDRVFRAISHLKKPVAILDIVGGWQLPRFLQKKNVQMFTAATSGQCGNLVARYLLDAGHTRIAYISPYHQAQWSKERYKAIDEIYITAGRNNCVALFSYDNPPFIDSLYHGTVHSQIEYAKLMDSYTRWRKDVPSHYADMLDPWFEQVFPENLLPRAEFNRQIYKLFECVLKEPGITAWVAANDTVALTALQFLKEREFRIPGDVSVISFDDTRESLHNSLTSFSFNMREAMYLIFNYLVNTRSMEKRSRMRAVEIGGKIIERATVKNLRKKE